MTNTDTVTLSRAEYDELLTRKQELEETLAARDADDGNRIPHEVALAIMRGKSPFMAFRHYFSITFRDLSKQTGISASYLSEIERGIKSGSTVALSRIATVFHTTIDVLVMKWPTRRRTVRNRRTGGGKHDTRMNA